MRRLVVMMCYDFKIYLTSFVTLLTKREEIGGLIFHAKSESSFLTLIPAKSYLADRTFCDWNVTTFTTLGVRMWITFITLWNGILCDYVHNVLYQIGL